MVARRSGATTTKTTAPTMKAGVHRPAGIGALRRRPPTAGVLRPSESAVPGERPVGGEAKRVERVVPRSDPSRVKRRAAGAAWPSSVGAVLVPPPLVASGACAIRTPAAASAFHAAALSACAENTNSTLLRLYVGPDTPMQGRPSTTSCHMTASAALKKVLRARSRDPKTQLVSWNESVRTAKQRRPIWKYGTRLGAYLNCSHTFDWNVIGSRMAARRAGSRRKRRRKGSSTNSNTRLNANNTMTTLAGKMCSDRYTKRSKKERTATAI